jgi:uncharacterized LabA/DUF88 family protein
MVERNRTKNVEEHKVYKFEKDKKKMIFPGDPSGLPDDFSEIIVFIDNAYLIRLKNYFFEDKFNYSIKNFVNVLSGKNAIIKKIYLYDAPPFQSKEPDEKENKMKKDYDKFISFFKNEGIVVREGRTQRLKVGNSFIYRQKGVDMLLGIDMVSILKEFPKLKNIVLLSGDSDFVPVVEKLKSFGIKVILWTYFEKNRKSQFSRSNYLIKSADKHIKITKKDFERAEKNGE